MQGLRLIFAVFCFAALGCGARAQQRVLGYAAQASAPDVLRGAVTLAHRPLFGIGARTLLHDLPRGPFAGTIAVRPMPLRPDLPRTRVCFNSAESREKILSNKLTEPFQALRRGRLQGDALRARLCRWKPDEFVYEISVLRRDGRIVHIYMNAQNGQDLHGQDLRIIDGPERH